MPYFVTEEGAHPDCNGYATVKDDGEIIDCHTTKEAAIDQMVAVSIAEDMEPGGTYEGDFRSEERAEPGELQIGDFVEWDSSGGMARGRIEHIMTEGVLGVPDSSFSINATEDDPAALIRIWQFDEGDEDESGQWEETEILVGHRFSTLTKIDALNERSEMRQVDLTPPAYMRASARRGLAWHEQGLSGDGLQPETVREARALANGSVSADKWVRIRAFLARHMVDFDAPAASPDHPNFPSPGVVAIALWGGGTTRRSAERAMEYADGVIGRIEAENEGRAKGQALSKMETRVTVTDFEVREEADGMHLTGYAARFNEFSEPLPFREKIAPGAFKRSLQSRNDVKLLWNHDSSIVLGSTRAGTLRLTEDDQGLRVSAILPDTQAGRDAKVLINRGDVTGFSFGFTVPSGGDSWNESGTERTLHAVRLLEVSTGVAFPAYPTTNGTAVVRGLDKVALRANVDADALADALLKLESGETISSDDRQLLNTVIDSLSDAPETPQEPEGSLEMLALKKKKLELLMGL